VRGKESSGIANKRAALPPFYLTRTRRIDNTISIYLIRSARESTISSGKPQQKGSMSRIIEGSLEVRRPPPMLVQHQLVASATVQREISSQQQHEDSAGTHQKRKRDEAKWLSKLELLRQYHEQNGHWQVPTLYAIDGVKLGAWLHNVRHAYKQHSQGVSKWLTQERINQLEALGFSFQQESGETKWLSKLELLKQYHERNGHWRVPLDYEIDGVKLGVWLQNLKYAYKQHSQGKPTVLTQERINRLETLGFVFQKESREEMWQSKIELLRQYKQANGHCRVPLKYEIDGVKLGLWLHSQRVQYNKHGQGKTTLSSTLEHMDQLKSIGVDFANNQQQKRSKSKRQSKLELLGQYKHHKQQKRSKSKWQSKVELLRQYKQANGHCRVPAKYEIDGVKLGVWLQNQRIAYKQHSQGKTTAFTQKRINQLEALGFNFQQNHSEEKWLSKVELLRQYKQANGHCRVPFNYEIDGVKLGIWLCSQRAQYNKCGQGKTALRQERIDILNAIDPDWNPRMSSNTTAKDDKMTAETRKRNALIDEHSSSLAEALSMESPHTAQQSSPTMKYQKLNNGSRMALKVGCNLGFEEEDNTLPTSPLNPSVTSLPKEITKSENWKQDDPDSGTKFETEQQ